MARKSITFTDRQEAKIGEEANRLQIPFNQVVGRILDNWIDGVDPAYTTPTAAEPEPFYHSAEQTGGTKMMRIWRITDVRLEELQRAYHPITKVEILDRLVNAPDEIIRQIMTGEYTPTITPTAETIPEPFPLPAEPTIIDRFLTDVCVYGPGLAVSMAAVYKSYEHYLTETLGPDATPGESRQDFWDRLMDRRVNVSYPTSTVNRMGLRSNAFAVTTGDAVAVDIE